MRAAGAHHRDRRGGVVHVRTDWQRDPAAGVHHRDRRGGTAARPRGSGRVYVSASSAANPCPPYAASQRAIRRSRSTARFGLVMAWCSSW